MTRKSVGVSPQACSSFRPMRGSVKYWSSHNMDERLLAELARPFVHDGHDYLRFASMKTVTGA